MRQTALTISTDPLSWATVIKDPLYILLRNQYICLTFFTKICLNESNPRAWSSSLFVCFNNQLSIRKWYESGIWVTKQNHKQSTCSVVNPERDKKKTMIEPYGEKNSSSNPICNYNRREKNMERKISSNYHYSRKKISWIVSLESYKESKSTNVFSTFIYCIYHPQLRFKFQRLT